MNKKWIMRVAFFMAFVFGVCSAHAQSSKTAVPPMDEEVKQQITEISQLFKENPEKANESFLKMLRKVKDKEQLVALGQYLVQEKNYPYAKLCGDNLELRRYTKTEDMHTGDFGILEPDNNTITDYSMIDLAVIPGVAFDSSCNRLGRGKGYYDRLLPKLHCPKIGICFKFQFVDSIPAEPHDILMDKIIFG